MASVGTVSHNQWYGFYNPLAVVSTVSGQTPGTVLHAFQRPVETASDMDAFVGVARVLPSFAIAIDSVARAKANYCVQPGLRGAGFDGETGEVLFVGVPAGEPPVNFLKSFFFAASCFIIPPEGVEIPEEVSMRTPDSARRLVASRQLARLALSETLLFQAALDMRAVGIDFIRTPISYGFLGASDIAMFRLMRERGLVDVIRRYYSFMKPHEREAFDSSVEAVSSHLIDGGAKTFLWQPRWPEVRPEVRRTFLDDVADAYAGYESGLFERSGGLQTLSQDRIAAIVGSMEGSVETTDDIGAVFSAIREVAPNVGEKVMSGEVMRFVDIVLVEGDGTDQRVLSRDSSLSGLIGEPRDPERDRVRIEIVKGTPKREIVGELVVHLARLTVPPALVAGYRGSMGPDRDSIRSVLTNMYAAMDMWGLSGAFEMYHEARLSGLDMSFNDTYSAIRAIIESLGFAVACERWSELLPQRIVSAVERMMTGYAVRAAAARAWGRPVTVLRQ